MQDLFSSEDKRLRIPFPRLLQYVNAPLPQSELLKVAASINTPSPFRQYRKVCLLNHTLFILDNTK